MNNKTNKKWHEMSSNAQQSVLGPTVFRQTFCKIPQLTDTKLSKFRCLLWPSVCA